MHAKTLRGLESALLIIAASGCYGMSAPGALCTKDESCPPGQQCLGAHGGSAGRCAEAVSGTPSLASGVIAVAPAAITGGVATGITLGLPALAGNADLARKLTLAIDTGGSVQPVVKSGGAAITFPDLGTAITVEAPATLATDSRTYTYTLTVSNAPSSTGSASATGTLSVIPAPALASRTLFLTPASITGGSSPALSLALPSLASPAGSASAVSLAISGCGSGAVSKSDGGVVGVADLGTTIAVASPSSTATDNKICTYTLTVSNAATTPASATASGTLSIVSGPVLASGTLAVAPGSITGGFAPTLSVALPAVMLAATVSGVSLAISGCGTGAVNKVGGSPVGPDDLGISISIPAPSTLGTDSKTCTYTLTVSNGANPPATAIATGTLAVIPQPVLESNVLSPSPAVITVGTASTISIPLPNRTSLPDSVGTVTLKVNDGNTTRFVAAAGLGTTVTYAVPGSSSGSATTLTFTLVIANSATTPATATATGTVSVVPAPVLSAATFTIAPASLAGGTTPNLGASLPGLTSPTAASNSVTFTLSSCGSGSVNKTNGSGGPVAAGDLGTAITFASPATVSTDSKTCAYTLTVANGATPPATATATGTLTVVPFAFSSALTVTPNVTLGGTPSPGPVVLHFALPTLANGGPAASISLTVTPAGGATTLVVKSNGAAPVAADLGTTVNVNPPPTLATDPPKVFTYALTATNSIPLTSAPITTTLMVYTPATNLTGARVGATTTLLPNGKVLVTGGGPLISQGVCAYTAGTTVDSNTAEVYDPGTGISTLVPGTMAVKRCQHTATMSGNRVYIMGGVNDTPANNVKIDVFIYNPGTPTVFGAWQTTTLPLLQTARFGHSATLLGTASPPNTGKIVVAGGYDNARAGLTSLELFDPASASGNGSSTTYTKTGGAGPTAFNLGRGEHAAVLVAKWLYFIGGFDGLSNYSSSIDALDTTLPANSGGNGGQITHTNAPANAIGRMAHSAIALNATTIMVVGGVSDSTGAVATTV